MKFGTKIVRLLSRLAFVITVLLGFGYHLTLKAGPVSSPTSSFTPGSTSNTKVVSLPSSDSTSSSYALDGLTFFLRGYNLNFDGDNAFEIGSVGADVSDNWSYYDNDVQYANSANVSSNVTFTKLGKLDTPYDWHIHGTAVKYDRDTMKMLRGNKDIDNCTSYCETSVSINVASEFGTEFNSDNYFYVVSILEFEFLNDDPITTSIGAEDLNAVAWIENSSAQTNTLDYDNDAGNGSNGIDHYVGKDGKLTVKLASDFNGPSTQTITLTLVMLSRLIKKMFGDTNGLAGTTTQLHTLTASVNLIPR